MNRTHPTAPTRRDVVKGAALAVGVSAVASAFQARPALAAEDVTFDEECDVLVVGSGYAGLAAAYEAAKAGAAVRVIDKRGFFGGNSYVADGQIAVVGSTAQKAAGVEDSVDALVSDMLAAGLSVALAAGALAIQLDQIQCYPYTSPDEASFGVAATWIEAESAYAPTIDPATGRRFVNELTDRKRFSDAMFACGQPLLQIGSVDNVPAWCTDSLEAALEAGVTVEFDSLEAICDAYDVPLDALTEQMDAYNACVEAGEDTEFGKLLNDDAKPVVTAPYYVTRTWPKVHHCMGGLKTTADCQCVDAFLQPIPGLYAAGEATGGVHGACRLGCNGTLDCLVHGRIAGQSVARA